MFLRFVIPLGIYASIFGGFWFLSGTGTQEPNRADQLAIILTFGIILTFLLVIAENTIKQTGWLLFVEAIYAVLMATITISVSFYKHDVSCIFTDCLTADPPRMLGFAVGTGIIFTKFAFTKMKKKLSDDQ